MKKKEKDRMIVRLEELDTVGQIDGKIVRHWESISVS